MSTWSDALFSVAQMRRYRRMRIDDAPRPRTWAVASSSIRWAFPVFVPAAAVTFADPADARGVALVVAVLCVLGSFLATTARTVHAFDLLRHPSRGGLVLAWMSEPLPYRLWTGACFAAGWWVLSSSFPSPERLAGVVALGVAPAGASAWWMHRWLRRRKGLSDELGSSGVAILLFVAWKVWRGASGDRPPRWDLLLALLGVLALVLVVVAALRRTRIVVALLDVCGFAATGACLLLFLPGTPRPEPTWPLLFAPFIVGASLLHARWAVRCADGLQIETRSSAATPTDAPVRRSASPLPRPRPGVGLVQAKLRYLAREWLHVRSTGETRWQHVAQNLFPAGLWTCLLLRAVVVIVVVVLNARDGSVLVSPALIAAFWAPRTGSVDSIELQERLWLFGVDRRTQALHGLRCMLVVGALPVLIVGALVTLIAAPSPESAWAALAVTAAGLLLRAGLPGLPPFRETHRVRLAFVWIALVLATLFVTPSGGHWSPDAALILATTFATLGAVGLALRLRRLTDPAFESRLAG